MSKPIKITLEPRTLENGLKVIELELEYLDRTETEHYPRLSLALDGIAEAYGHRIEKKEKKLGKCKFCEEPIYWAKSFNGKNISFNNKPIGRDYIKEGDLVAQLDLEKCGKFNSKFYDDAEYYKCHFDTCVARKG